MKQATALAALVVTTLGLMALPVAAQDQAMPVAKRGDHQVHRMFRGMGPGRGAGVLGLVCSDRGAEALEIAFGRWSHRLDLTAEQKELFDALKARALTTQTSFADQCAAALPERTAGAMPDLLESFKARLAVEEARLTAMNDILPDFEAFYTSLTDDQKAELMPRMTHRDADPRDRNAPGRSLRAPTPGRS